MNIDERIRADIERGDIGLARDRLLAHINTKGYDPDQLARLGEFSHQMHDLFSAGKYWLTSSAEGEKVDRAIETFAARCGRDPRQMVSQLPMAVRRTSIDDYPPGIQQRLRQWKMDEALKERAARTNRSLPTTVKDRVVMLSCIVVAIFGMICACVGVSTVMRWLWSFLYSPR